jgi:hypothetical protein
MQDDLDSLTVRAKRACLTDMLIELELLRLREPAPPAVDSLISNAYGALETRERESWGDLSAEAR